jgi:serine/threonine protein kinase
LIRKNPDSPGIINEQHICIGDFGLCVMLIPPFTNKAKARCGTIMYHSPEQIEGAEYDYAVDIFSVAVITASLLTGTHPFVKERRHDTEAQKQADWSRVVASSISK